MDRIIKLSRFFKGVFAVIFWGSPVALLLVWFQDQTNFLARMGFSIANFVPGNLDVHILTPLSLTSKVWGCVVGSIPVIIGMLIAFSLMRLFSCYQNGAIFTSESIMYLRRVGLIMLVWAVLNPLYQVLMSLVVTSHSCRLV